MSPDEGFARVVVELELSGELVAGFDVVVVADGSCDFDAESPDDDFAVVVGEAVPAPTSLVAPVVGGLLCGATCTTAWLGCTTSGVSCEVVGVVLTLVRVAVSGVAAGVRTWLDAVAETAPDAVGSGEPPCL